MVSLEDFARNPDGKTYDGRKVAQWLFQAMTGKPMSDDDAQRLVDEAKARAETRRRQRGKS